MVIQSMKDRNRSQMSDANVNIGIIGCSSVAQRKTIPAIMKARNASIVRIGSRSIEKARQWCDTFGCEQAGSYRDVVTDPNVDAVYISLPPSLHEEWAANAIKAGMHVLCEKPLTTSLESTQRLVGLAEKSDVGLFEGYMFRYHPQHARVRDLITRGTLGEVRTFSGRFGFPFPSEDDIRLQNALGGGVLNDAGGYPIYASRMILDGEPEAAFCSLTINHDYKIDERAEVILWYGNGQTAKISVGFGMYFQSQYSLWGSRARVSVDRAYAVPPRHLAKVFLDKNDEIQVDEIESPNQVHLMIEDFCSSLASNDHLEIFETWRRDILGQARVVEAARISHDEQRIVEIETLR